MAEWAERCLVASAGVTEVDISHTNAHLLGRRGSRKRCRLQLAVSLKFSWDLETGWEPWPDHPLCPQMTTCLKFDLNVSSLLIETQCTIRQGLVLLKKLNPQAFFQKRIWQTTKAIMRFKISMWGKSWQGILAIRIIKWLTGQTTGRADKHLSVTPWVAPCSGMQGATKKRRKQNSIRNTHSWAHQRQRFNWTPLISKNSWTKLNPALFLNEKSVTAGRDLTVELSRTKCTKKREFRRVN